MLTPHAGLRKKRTAQSQGRKAVASGRNFEAIVKATHDAYARNGLGVVAKLHPETAGPPNARRFVAPGAVDYMGALTLDGLGTNVVPVAFDAKATSNCATWTLDTRPKAREVEQRQLRFLLEFARYGAAFLLIYDRGLSTAFLIHGDGLRQLHDAGAVPLRAKQRDGAYSTPWPDVRLANVGDIARGLPALDYRPLLGLTL